ncbi:unnamed protein product, partial [Allacma fusca]
SHNREITFKLLLNRTALILKLWNN